MAESIALLIVGALISLISSLVTASFQHRLELKRQNVETKHQEALDKAKKEEEMRLLRAAEHIEILKQAKILSNEQAKIFISAGATGERGLRLGSIVATVFCRLQVESGPDLGTNLPVKQHTMTIGQAADFCGLTLSDPNVADIHLRLLIADTAFVLEDISGGYGTRINDSPVSSPRILANNDLITIGNSSIRFSVE